FTRAYHAHAELRAVAYAHLDSAVNHASTSADSARYLERAAAITVRLPQPGTVEGNVITSYTTNLTTMLRDGNHPCNWDIPF
ncbi:MAG TPA: hypothetical protein VMN39_00305, partial [Longimicrobiaceae bacterium]|nr:hypothetical protein [Longimicrobiaceae bacterium]